MHPEITFQGLRIVFDSYPDHLADIGAAINAPNAIKQPANPQSLINPNPVQLEQVTGTSPHLKPIMHKPTL